MRATRAQRSNNQWLNELRDPTTRERASADLRSYLSRVLARVLSTRAQVDSTELEDFTQDALLRVLQSLGRFRGDSRFTTWATAVAVRVALGHLRRRRHAQGPTEAFDLDACESRTGGESLGCDPGRSLERRALLDALRDAIRDVLTQRQRAAILGELAGVPSTVLAERLGTNPNAFYKLHHDARKKLKQALNAAGYSDDDVRHELLVESQGS